MSNISKGDKVKFGNQTGQVAETLTRDTVINGQKFEASVAHPKIRVVENGHSVVKDAKEVTKL
jgi:hypothetical protein